MWHGRNVQLYFRFVPFLPRIPHVQIFHVGFLLTKSHFREDQGTLLDSSTIYKLHRTATQCVGYFPVAHFLSSWTLNFLGLDHLSGKQKGSDLWAIHSRSEIIGQNWTVNELAAKLGLKNWKLGCNAASTALNTQSLQYAEWKRNQTQQSKAPWPFQRTLTWYLILTAPPPPQLFII